MTRVLAVLVLLAAGTAAAQPAAPAAAPTGAPPPVTRLKAVSVDNDDGRHLHITFARAPANVPPDARVMTLVLRATTRDPAAVPPPVVPLGVAPEAKQVLGPWAVAAALAGGETEHTDEVEPEGRYLYSAVEVRLDEDGRAVAPSPPVTVDRAIAPVAGYFHWKRWGFLLIVVAIGALILVYVQRARTAPESIFIRRIPGIDAIEDAVGRSTEMGRPVLYVTGLEEIQDIQTLASLLILGHVAELTATYDTEIKVANYYPMTMVVAEEIVRQGYANAGRIDAHRPENVMFITAEQFAFAAGVNGMILRDRPATNIYFGKFFGESLLLAETGFLTGAVQIAGTAELAQLPFFVAACDYTLIGEEMYATSAYLSREPTLLANLKAGDRFKAAAIVFVLVGAVLATAGVMELGPLVFP